MKTIKNLKAVLVTHYRIYSASQALRDYLRRHDCQNLLYISHPLPIKGENEKESSYYEVSNGINISRKKESLRIKENILIGSFKDLILTLKWSLKNGKYDLYIGVDNLNALAGLVLKLLGRTEKVIYYTIDYFPTRFNNSLLNSIYHGIDKLCVKYADETWNVSSKMIYAREKYNKMSPSIYKKQYTVPIGIWYENAPRKNFRDIDKRKMIFSGHLIAHMGVDLVIKALPKLMEEFPDIKLEIIGGGEEEKALKSLAKNLGVLRNIKFWGWVKDRIKLETILSSGAIGLATFNTDILDEKVKNADPGKIKDYMLLGLPVISTKAISTAKEIEREKCGIIINYNVSDFVSAVIQLMDSKRLEEYRKNALSYIKKFDYNRIFQKNLSRVLKSYA